jgi:hypothetical protein
MGRWLRDLLMQQERMDAVDVVGHRRLQVAAMRPHDLTQQHVAVLHQLNDKVLEEALITAKVGVATDSDNYEILKCHCAASSCRVFLLCDRLIATR